MKTYTDDDWFLIWLFPLLSELFYLGLHATDITFLCLNLRFGLEPKYLASYPNSVHFFLFPKTLYFLFPLFSSHFYISPFLCPFFAARQLFLDYYLNFLGYFCFFHLAILSGWSLKILDNCQGFLDIWQSIWNRMGNFICVSAHMQMMPKAHVEAIAQIPAVLACRAMCYTGGLEMDGNSSIFEKIRATTCSWICWMCTNAVDFMHSCSVTYSKWDSCCTDNSVSSFHSTLSGLLHPLLCSTLSACGNINLGVHASSHSPWTELK